jgi:hypothetical protein
VGTRSVLVGQWLNGTVADTVCREIERRVTEDLVRVADRESGWAVLYRDRTNGELWELSHPQSHLHGGGPPSLENLTREEAVQRYGQGVDV